ncbi:MAG: DUF2764 family protein [Candidatus Omnitrophota bacterium]
MRDRYIYLASSLPYLQLHNPPSFGLEEFLDVCLSLVDERELELLKLIPDIDYSLLHPDFPVVLRQWCEFEGSLRNELVQPRALRKKIDPQKYIRPDYQSAPHITHVAMSAYRNTSIIDAEHFLDGQRWDFLDGLSFGHYFDFDFLIIYTLKLIILKRWKIINSADKRELFNQAYNIT